MNVNEKYMMLSKHIASQTFPFGNEIEKRRLADSIERAINSALEIKGSVDVGWSCPRCSRIYGPSVQICCVCNTKVAAKENP